MKRELQDTRDAARAGVLLALLPVVLLSIGLDAGRRRHGRHAEDAAALAACARLPSSDLALSGGARWLRFPSLEESTAAFDDAPALPDPDPAGGMISPPQPPLSIWTKGFSSK